MLIIDGTFLIYKSYFNTENLKEKIQIDNDEQFIKITRNTFLRKVVFLLKKYEENEIIFFFDSAGKNFRHELMPYYKKKRQKKPEIVNDIKKEIYHFLDISGFTYQISSGVEADDLIASYVKKHPKKTINIYTGDNDLAALVNPKVQILFEKHNTIQKINTVNFSQMFQVPPRMLFDYKSFIGDTSDNIKGLKTSPKDVIHLLLEFHTIENFFEKGQEHCLYSKLIDKKDFLLKNKKVLTLKTDCVLTIEEKKILVQTIKMPKVIAEKIKWDF